MTTPEIDTDLVEQVAQAMWRHRMKRDMREFGAFTDMADVPWEDTTEHVRISLRNEARAVLGFLAIARPDMVGCQERGCMP